MKALFLSIALIFIALSAQITHASSIVESVRISEAVADCSRFPVVRAVKQYPNSKYATYILQFKTMNPAGEFSEILLQPNFQPKTPINVMVDNETQKIQVVTKEGSLELGSVATGKETSDYCKQNPQSKFNFQSAEVELATPLQIEKKTIKKGCEKRYGVVPFLEPSTYEWVVEYSVTLRNDKGQQVTFTDFKRIGGHRTISSCLAEDKLDKTNPNDSNH